MLLISIGLFLTPFAFLDKVFDKRFKKVFLFILSGLFIILGGVRWNTGTDWDAYYYGFQGTETYQDATGEYSFEWGFSMLNYFVNQIGGDYTVFLLLFTFIKVLLKYKVLIKVFVVLPILLNFKVFQNNTKIRGLLNVLVFGCVVYFVLGSISSEFKRINSCFEIYEIVLIPYLIYNVRVGRLKTFLITLYILYAISRLYSGLQMFWDLYDPFYTIFDLHNYRMMK